MHTRALLLVLLVTTLLGSSALTPRPTGAGIEKGSIGIVSINDVPFDEIGDLRDLVFVGAQCFTIRYEFTVGFAAPSPGRGAASVNGQVVLDGQAPGEFTDVGDGIRVRVDRERLPLGPEDDPVDDIGEERDAWTVTICTSDTTPDGTQIDAFFSTFVSHPDSPDPDDAHTPTPLTFGVVQPDPLDEVILGMGDVVPPGDAAFHITGDPPIDVTDPDTGGMLDFPVQIVPVNLRSDGFGLIVTDPLAPPQPGDPTAAGRTDVLRCPLADDGSPSCAGLDGRNWTRTAEASFTGSTPFALNRNPQILDLDLDGTLDLVHLVPPVCVQTTVPSGKEDAPDTTVSGCSSGGVSFIPGGGTPLTWGGVAFPEPAVVDIPLDTGGVGFEDGYLLEAGGSTSWGGIPIGDTLGGPLLVLGGPDPEGGSLTVCDWIDVRDGASCVPRCADEGLNGDGELGGCVSIGASDPNFGGVVSGRYREGAYGGALSPRDLRAAQGGQASGFCAEACLAVGAPADTSGAASTVYLIDPNLLPPGDTFDLIPGVDWARTISGIPNGHRGLALTLADLNLDGAMDIVIGVPGADSGDVQTAQAGASDETGAAYVVEGPFRTGALGDLVVRAYVGGASGELFGGDVEVADLNGDGLPDLLITARFHKTGPFVVPAGAVFAFYATPDQVVAQTRSVNLVPGLNLVAWTGDTAIPDATASIAGLFSQILGWDAAAQGYVSFIPGLPAVVQGVTDLNTGDAFWIVMDQAATWEQPAFNDARSVALLAGLNLAMWTGPAMDIEGALEGLAAADAVFRWNGVAYDTWRRGAPVGNTLETLANGDAFFIRLAAAATWEQPAR